MSAISRQRRSSPSATARETCCSRQVYGYWLIQSRIGPSPRPSVGASATVMPPRPGSASAGRSTGSRSGPSHRDERGLVHAHRHRGHDLLRSPRTLSAAPPRSPRLDLPSQARHPRGHDDVPAHRAAPGPGPGVTSRRSSVRAEARHRARDASRPSGGRWRCAASPRRACGRPPARAGQAGQHHQVLRRADRGRRPVPKSDRAARGHRDDAKAGERVVERHLDRRLAAASSGTRAFQSSSVSNSSRVGCRPPPPPAGKRLEAEVPLADHLHLRRRRLDARSRAAASSPSRRFQLGLGGELEQALVDRGERDLGPGRGRRPSAVRAHDVHARLLAHAVRRAVGRDARPSARCARQPTLISAMPSLNAGRPRSTSAVGCDAADAAAHDEHRDEDVRRVARRHRHLDHGLLAASASRRARRARLRARRVTSAVASRNGMRTCRRAVSPGS